MGRVRGILKILMVKDGGFTLIELLVAMAIFGFMLLIISSGFINIVHIHNQALAANIVEDNARTVMNELIRGVRTSNGALPGAGGLCLSNAVNGIHTLYYLDTVDEKMKRADSPTCDVGAVANVQEITSSVVKVKDFTYTPYLAGSPKQKVDLSLTIIPDNGTTYQDGAGKWLCGPNNEDRTFCSVITLNSGAVPR